MADEQLTKMLHIEVPASLNPALANLVKKFAGALAAELHQVEQFKDTSDVRIELGTSST